MVRGRRVALAGAAILEQPAAVVVLVEAEDRIALEYLADNRREAWPADHDEVVAVQVQLATNRDVLGCGLQLEVAGQVGEQVVGGEVLLGDDGSAAGGLGLERDGHGQAVGAEEDTLGWRASPAELGDARSADADDVGDGGQISDAGGRSASSFGDRPTRSPRVAALGA